MRNTTGNPAPVPASAVKVRPIAAMVADAPTESEIDRAEELKPWFCGVEYARVRTVSRGYMRPIPPPASAHPAMRMTGGRCSQAVSAAIAVAPTSCAVPMSEIRVLPIRSP